MNMAISGNSCFSSEQIDTLNQIINGKYDTIDANYIYTKLIQASKAQFNELASHIITADWISSNQAVFNFVTTEVFNADIGNIKTILAGGVGTGSLQSLTLTSANAVIDQSFVNVLMANYINAASIFGNKISTTEFEVGSDDGTFKISDNTLTIKDQNNHTRVQLGEDADGQFSFLLLSPDGTGTIIDKNGITENGIANGLIESEKLADKSNDYSGISADKLNIDSVVNGINNGNMTINSTKVYFDDEDKSLNTIMQEMSTHITHVSGKLLYDVVITSLNGTQISDTTVLTANVYDYGTTSPAGGSFSYSWYKNGILISSAVNRTYTVNAADIENGAEFTCKVSYS